MKSGVTAMTAAAIALRRAGVRLNGDLMVAAVVGELQAGVGTIYLLDHGFVPDMAVITEPYGTHNIITKHAGVCEMAIHTFGRCRHVSLKEEGIDAIKKMMKVLDALDRMTFTHTPDAEFPGLPRMNVGSIIGGRGPEHELRGPYYVSDHCTVFVDIRFCRGMSPDTIKEDIERELAKLASEDPDLRFEVEFPADPKYGIARVWMHPLDISPEEPIVQAVRRGYLEVTGKEPDHIGTPLPVYRGYAGNDTAHFWQRGVPCCIFGPGGDWETWKYSNVDEMVLCAKVLALTALEVCGYESNPL
jgi:acetylornithine deacetylase